jgi:beta-glucosidase-like glycosyl hydrolase
MSRSAARLLSFLLMLLLAHASLQAQPHPKALQRRAAKEKQQAARQWADSIYNRLSAEERIGQLFMVAAYSGGPKFNQDSVERLIRNHQIGGLIFMQGGAGRQALLTNRYQAMAQVPLLISMDAEWGLGMRLDSILNFPRQMMLGATDDTVLAYQMGMAIAYQCRRLGVHINFAPVVDVNNNPANPVINFRSFGEDKKRVTRMAIAYMRGMQDYGVMACAKHFPGHGDTDVDSHKELPVVNKSLAQLDTLELYPFRQMIAAGIQSMMVAHLSVPALETEAHVPTTLSRNTVTGLLRNKMGFSGLIFTDALNMQGVAKYFEPGEVDLRAFVAGNDVLLFSQNVPLAIQKIKAAIDAGKISSADLEQRVKKLLIAKYDAGLSRFKPIDTKNITEDINQYTAALNEKIAAAAVTVVRRNGLLNDWHLGPGEVTYVAVNGTLQPETEALWKGQAEFNIINMPKGITAAAILQKLSSVEGFVIVGIHGLTLYPANNYGLDDEQLKFLAAVQQKEVVIALMGNAYALKFVCQGANLIAAYEDNEWTQAAVFQAIISVSSSGKLPVTPPCLN